MGKKVKNIKLEESVLRALAIQAVHAGVNLQNYIEAVLVVQADSNVITIGDDKSDWFMFVV